MMIAGPTNNNMMIARPTRYWRGLLDNEGGKLDALTNSDYKTLWDQANPSRAGRAEFAARHRSVR